MLILTNYNTGHMKICHYREINDDAELVMLSIRVIDGRINLYEAVKCSKRYNLNFCLWVSDMSSFISAIQV
jgi:DNA-binding cell septation regulator SpoVG